MEEILNKILAKLDKLEEGQKKFDKEQANMRQDLSKVVQEQSNMRQDLSKVVQEQSNMRQDLSKVIQEQAEMRKEMAFFYGSLMRKMDETKLELSSEIKQISKVQQEHQIVLKYLNQKQ